MANYIAFELEEDEFRILRRLKQLAKTAGKDSTDRQHKVLQSELLENLSVEKYEAVLVSLADRGFIQFTHNLEGEAQYFFRPVTIERIRFGITLR